MFGFIQSPMWVEQCIRASLLHVVTQKIPAVSKLWIYYWKMWPSCCHKKGKHQQVAENLLFCAAVRKGHLSSSPGSETVNRGEYTRVSVSERAAPGYTGSDKWISLSSILTRSTATLIIYCLGIRESGIKLPKSRMRGKIRIVITLGEEENNGLKKEKKEL